MSAETRDPREYDYSSPSRSCDMVMKGGITSGVVYPHAVCELAQVYRFRSVGGASAGAIAAAATAAAERGRQSGGFRKLAELPEWLGGNLVSLFQPQRSTHGLFAILIAAIGGGRLRGLRILGTAVRRFPFFTLLGSLPGLVLLVIVAASTSGGGRVAAIFSTAVLALLGAAIGLAYGIYRSATRSIPGNYFGVCTGMEGADGGDAKALTPWLADLLEDLAGRAPSDEPLTFGDLWGGDTPDADDGSVRLEMMTTNLTNRRPHRLPWDERVFYFKPEELLDLFPAHVVGWMVDHPPPAPEGEHDRRLSELRVRLLGGLAQWPPPQDLPVIVAARMSLSFPLLISAVPLWAVDMSDPATQNVWEAWVDWLRANESRWDEIKDDPSAWEGAPPRRLEAERCWFSDGGISSNFPVHFFDEPVPVRPTFAINLAGFRPRERPDPDESENVWLPGTNQGGLLETWYRFHPTSGRRMLTGFASAIVRTMQNHVDSAQMRVPGYRDRIVHVKFTSKEGGMNLTMPPGVIRTLTERGRWAGAKLVGRFHLPPAPGALSWDNHRWVRFRSSLAVAAEFLQRFAAGYSTPPEVPGERTFAELSSRGRDEPPSSYRWRNRDQRGLADDAVVRVVELSDALAASEESLSDGAPRPEPEARVVPRV